LQFHELLFWSRYIEFSHLISNTVGRLVRAGSRSPTQTPPPPPPIPYKHPTHVV
jgi:hypothetical protein